MISFRTGTTEPIKRLHSTVNKGVRLAGREGMRATERTKTTLIMYSNPWICLWNMVGFQTRLDFRGTVRNQRNNVWFWSRTYTDMSVMQEHNSHQNTTLTFISLLSVFFWRSTVSSRSSEDIHKWILVTFKALPNKFTQCWLITNSRYVSYGVGFNNWGLMVEKGKESPRNENLFRQRITDKVINSCAGTHSPLGISYKPTVYPSIHQILTAYPRLGQGSNRLSKECQTSLSIATQSSSS